MPASDHRLVSRHGNLPNPPFINNLYHFVSREYAFIASSYVMGATAIEAVRGRAISRYRGQHPFDTLAF